MPPKQQSKADLAKKQKIVEDKTFGLKNKNKSKNVQKYVQNLKQSVQPNPDPTKVAAKKKKEEDKAKEKELNDLFKVAVSQPKVPIGVDPKSILCEFYKVGQCAKGFKCKFSHDLNVQRKGEKIDLYSDKRDQETMEDWDQETLEKVVESKKTEYNQNKPTDIMKALLEEETEKIPIEEEIENQRAKVTTSTPMTPELFMQWKKKNRRERCCGRELFLSDSSIFVDDAEAYDEYRREEQPDVPEEKANVNSSADGPSTSATSVANIEDDDDDELDMDELNELEASLAKTSIQIQEPGRVN
ncbi:hypothetical protein GH714_039424 [Hevea brasiliensis]|uniref:C3H1-type domain-containing protein n=1 Tax=Hevea brasiliensis TaxID=3981 RepID=A0A6A6KMM0_HEVBR|nr:hypothetical protein GH714_039424 [Hevea brasiliensis]